MGNDCKSKNLEMKSECFCDCRYGLIMYVIHLRMMKAEKGFQEKMISLCLKLVDLNQINTWIRWRFRFIKY